MNTKTSLDGVPNLADLTARSGLEYMRDVLNGHLPGPSIGATLGFHLTKVEDGRVSFEGTPDGKSLNIVGAVHGGWYGALLDSCLGCAVMTRVPKGWVYTTLEFKVNLTRAIPPGTLVQAIGTVDHVGRSTGVANGVIRGVDDGRLYGTGSTTCLVMQAPVQG